ncbi:epoxyqueuosine reductase [Azotosporobacter soli]|uniref:epoxyqueuosine reductase n=1 Tax=Azotosporobacter soli TaxID=3055040 RepID=UPI0031FEA2FA
MQTALVAEINRFVAAAEEERCRIGLMPLFEEPLVGVAAATDPLFAAQKQIIGTFHLTPQELVEQSGEEGIWQAASVICWVLPIGLKARSANRAAVRYPSREWAEVRSRGEEFNTALRRHVVSYIMRLGHRAIAPQLSPVWQSFADTPVGIASNWSERHVAHIAGLGTFGLNDGLITNRGIAHRLGSVITDLPLAATRRSYTTYREYCLYSQEGRCGICIGRCPAGALSKQGHDKERCRKYVYGDAVNAVSEEYGCHEVGCGLCQTKVPCEDRIP